MPDRNAALIIHADAGGSSDLFGREVAKLLVDSKAVPVAVSPENRPGGSGAVAYTFMKSKTGDPNYLATLSSSYLTAPLSEDLEYSYEDFTNLGFLCADALMIAVRKDSFASLDELITAGKAALGSLKFGGTQTGSADSILLYLLEEKTGVKFTYVSFEGGSEVNAALLGSNVDVIATNPAEVKGLIDGDRVTGLAVSTAERMEGIDVPTMKEAGVDIEFSQARGIMAPGGITDEQKSFWVEALRTVGQSEEFAAWVTDQVMIPIEYYGDEAEQFVASESEKYVEYYKALGLS
ncbi:tripartite tricarboxylate transporter substrate binding protein [Propionimicrobium sp. PCR01-08-3]|uniref:tripartite tricarboxylate transporter substrate binding protein n=1 Tax=Propionimicrobium sp. PCR01-08-3 TaxID=3052086 RepID=UPI00255C8D2F|nr:tripartite tricarboxylate transporter substrate binding protein [Propionimicrobium sp. PCR01-08-3]WIY81886.1 tripartite tricarboxylate transporter substrate binding protein [Propionimicrobium sp. PCR01-08-3]